ncbi:MAG: signal recognition particle-docking protein FtsY [Bacteroidia bacterium]|nr:signal recognition particle-docking protein FtsY [Bacteroidia bacterium]
MALFKFFGKKENKEKLDKGLDKTKSSFLGKIKHSLLGKSRIDDDVLDDLEEVFIGSDVGVDATVKLIDRIRDRVARDKYTGTSELDNLLRDEMAQMMLENYPDIQEDFDVPEIRVNGKKMPYVILVVGVNGVGKTTTIGKLANAFKSRGKKVILGAADTFRAAAVEQIRIWAGRVDVPLVEKGMNTDPSAVAFDAVRAGIEQEADIVIIDTAGRLQTKINLMAELTKIKRSCGKNLEGAPHEVLLVLDASTGQNAISQAKAFTEATDVSALALTKLDGTAKGGVVIGIVDQFKIPVRFIGVGEGINDLQIFDPREFVDSLFK